VQSKVGLDATGAVFGDAVKLARVRFLSVGEDKSAPLSELALLEDENLLVAAECRLIGQQSVVPVPLDLRRRYRTHAAHDTGILADGRLGVTAGYQQNRAAGEVVYIEIGEGTLEQLMRAVTYRCHEGRHVMLDEPYFHLTQVTVARP